ncbi:MAG: hypothetical protein GXO18_07100 [Aquificae bacterium]|nr:hypothetical protein [Aquificota bacterium]
MRRFITKRLVYVISLAVVILFLGYTLPALGELRNTITREYFKHKEFLFNLSKAKLSKRETATESSVREVLKSLGVQPESVFMTESGVEVQIEELSWRKLPVLVKKLEERFRLVSLSAVDNTGKGVFQVRLVVR